MQGYPADQPCWRVVVPRLPLRRGAGNEPPARAPGEAVGDGVGMSGGEGPGDGAPAGVVLIAADDAVQPLLLQQQRVRPPAEAVRLAVLVLQRGQPSPAVPAAADLPALRVAGGDKPPGVVIAELAAPAVGALVGHRQPLPAPRQRLQPAPGALQLNRAPRRIVTVAGFFPVGGRDAVQPAQRVVAVAGHPPGAVHLADKLPRVVVLLRPAVARGVGLFRDLTRRIPRKARGLPQRIDDARQAVMFVVPEAGGRPVRLNDGRRQGAVRQPPRGAGVALRVSFPDSVARLVVGKGRGIPQRVGALRQLFIVVPRKAPAFAALVDKAGNQALRVPVVAAGLAVIRRDRGQPGIQVIGKAAAVAGAGPVLHHPPVVQLLPAVFALQTARQPVPGHQPFGVIAVLAGDDACRIGNRGQLTTLAEGPAHQRPVALAVEVARGGHPLRVADILVVKRNVNGQQRVVDAHQAPGVIAHLQRVAVFVAQGGQPQQGGVIAGRLKQPPDGAVIVANGDVARLVAADNHAFADAVERLVNGGKRKRQFASGVVEPGDAAVLQGQIAVKYRGPAPAKQPFPQGQAVVAALPAQREVAGEGEVELVVVVQDLDAGGGVNRVEGAEYGINGHVGQHPAACGRKRTGHIAHYFTGASAKQRKSEHDQLQAGKLAAFYIAHGERVAADNDVR